VHPWAALFENSYFWHELIHMYIAGFMVAGFLTASAYAWPILRGRTSRYNRTALIVPLTIAALAAPVQIVVGDWAGRQVAEDQPVKLAAFEGLGETTEGASLHLGGIYQDGQAVPVKLRILFAATNELPENIELAALKDRFCLKVACRSVQDEHFVELIDAGLDAYTQRELNQKPWVEGHASLEDFVKAHRWLTHVLARRTIGPDGNSLRDRDVYCSDELLRELRRVLKTLVREDGVFVSDRKVVKLYRLLRTHAWIVHGGAIERSDLRLLSYLGETRDEIDLLEDKVPRLLGLS